MPRGTEKLRKTKRFNKRTSFEARRGSGKIKRRFFLITIKIKRRINCLSKQRSSY